MEKGCCCSVCHPDSYSQAPESCFSLLLIRVIKSAATENLLLFLLKGVRDFLQEVTAEMYFRRLFLICQLKRMDFMLIARLLQSRVNFAVFSGG